MTSLDWIKAFGSFGLLAVWAKAMLLIYKKIGCETYLQLIEDVQTVTRCKIKRKRDPQS